MQDIIEKWKELKIVQGDFRFNCGGDSMGDTETWFENESGEEFQDSDLGSYFENEVYNHVQFYEASDGHYMGESGNVYITLNDEGDDFEYTKSAQSEWCERYSGEIECEVTEEEAKFLTEYIGAMSQTNWNGKQTDYKKDFILTDEHEQMIEGLHTKFEDSANEWQPEDMKGEFVEDSTTYNTAEDEGEVELTLTEREGKHFVKLYVGCEVYEYTDAED